MELATFARRAACVAATIAFAGLAACERHSDVPPGPSTPDASANLIGTPPAPPSGSEPPGVTPVTANTTEVSKNEETTKMPREGDNHSYSTVAPETPQKAGGKNTTGSNEEKPQ